LSNGYSQNALMCTWVFEILGNDVPSPKFLHRCRRGRQ